MRVLTKSEGGGANAAIPARGDANAGAREHTMHRGAGVGFGFSESGGLRRKEVRQTLSIELQKRDAKEEAAMLQRAATLDRGK